MSRVRLPNPTIPALPPAFPVIHAVTDNSAFQQPDFIERATAIMSALGPRGALHLRSSRLTGRSFARIAETLSEVQRVTGCWLIVNDRVDIARAVDARGVQLASHSLRIPEARSVAPEMPVGTSIHSVAEACEAEAEGAAWCVAGTVFETPSHLGRIPAHIDFIAQVVAAVRIPVIAIGGIKAGDVAALRAAGAHGVATIRGAGWTSTETVDFGETNQPGASVSPARNASSEEPVRRYISAYDADDGSGDLSQSDSERSSSRGSL